MKIDREPKMVFKPHGAGVIVIENPEGLAQNGISIHPDVMRRNWGPDAVDRYNRAKFEMKGAIKF